MDDLGPGGGFIIAPSHEMPGDIPLENMLALIETVRAQSESIWPSSFFVL